MLPAIALLLSVALFGLPTAASEEQEAATTISSTQALKTPEFMDVERLGDTPVTVAPPVTAPTPSTGDEPVTTTTAKTTAVIDTPGNNNEPSNSGWLGGLIQSVLDAVGGIGAILDKVWDKITQGFTDLTSDIATLSSDVFGLITDVGTAIKDGFAGLWNNLATTLITAFIPLGGRSGMMELLKLGGSQYVSNSLNDTIGALFDVFEVYGVVIMLLCFCFSIARGCFTTDLSLSAKNSIIQPVLGMIIALAAFSLSEEIMSALFTISMNLTADVVDAGDNADFQSYLNKVTSQTKPFSLLGYTVLNSIIQLMLMLNVAKIALLQSIAPFFIGFASGQGTRRLLINFVKEYGKCCLMPPVTAAYAIITFTISDSTWGMVSSIVIGFSILSIGNKMLDRLLN